MTPSNYSAVIIKPDAHRDMLAEMIIRDLENNGLVTIFRKDKILSREEAERIYTEHRNAEHYEASVRSIEGGKEGNTVTVLIVKSESGDALKLTNEIKGRSDAGGVRLKYRRFSKKELEELGYSGENLMLELAKNRLHVPNSDDRSLELINMMLSGKERDNLRLREPELYNELEGWKKENREIKLLFEKKELRREMKIR